MDSNEIIANLQRQRYIMNVGIGMDHADGISRS